MRRAECDVDPIRARARSDQPNGGLRRHRQSGARRGCATPAAARLARRAARFDGLGDGFLSAAWSRSRVWHGARTACAVTAGGSVTSSIWSSPHSLRTLEDLSKSRRAPCSERCRRRSASSCASSADAVCRIALMTYPQPELSAFRLTRIMNDYHERREAHGGLAVRSMAWRTELFALGFLPFGRPVHGHRREAWR